MRFFALLLAVGALPVLAAEEAALMQRGEALVMGKVFFVPRCDGRQFQPALSQAGRPE